MADRPTRPATRPSAPRIATVMASSARVTTAPYRRLQAASIRPFRIRPRAGGRTRVSAPLFTDVLHVAVVVADLEAAMGRYNDHYGIGPWSIYEFGPETVESLTRDDEPAEFAMRVALAPVGNSFVELIE